MCVARACGFGESNIVCIVMVRSIAWNKEYHLTSAENISEENVILNVSVLNVVSLLSNCTMINTTGFE